MTSLHQSYKSRLEKNVEPIPYKVYTLFLNYLVNRQKPTEKELKDAGMTVTPNDDAELSHPTFNNEAAETKHKQSTFYAGRQKLNNDTSKVSTNKLSQSIIDNAVSRHMQQKTKEEVYGMARAIAETNSKDDNLCVNRDDDFQVLAYANSKRARLNHDSAMVNVEKQASASYKPSACFTQGRIAEHTAQIKDPLGIGSKSYPKRLQQYFAPSYTDEETEEATLMGVSRKLKFMVWAKKMYAMVSLAPDGKNFEVVSLMSKKSSKEIAPIESFGHVVLMAHSQNGKLGAFHLSLNTTVQQLKSVYTFGAKDFGLTEDFVSRAITKCEDPLCTIKVSNLSQTNLKTNTKKSITGLPAYLTDKFYPG